MKKFNEFKALLSSLEGDADKFYNKGNNAAGTRVRKGMQDLKNLAQEIRMEIQETKTRLKHSSSKNLKENVPLAYSGTFLFYKPRRLKLIVFYSSNYFCF